jgi:hypothetical protein
MALWAEALTDQTTLIVEVVLASLHGVSLSSLWNSKSAFAVFTTVPWNHTTKRYQTGLFKRHDGTKPWPRYRRDGSDGTIEIEKLGVALIIALFVGYWRTSSMYFGAFFRGFLRFCISVPLYCSKSRGNGPFC